VTDGLTTVETLDPAAVIAIDLWSDYDEARGRAGAALGGALPGRLGSADLTGGWRALRVEPTVWWLTGPLEGLEGAVAALEAALGEDGAAVDLTGGLIRLEVAGPGWRELLMIGGVFDAENPAFGPGSTAGTILHHVGVRYDVVDDDRVHIFVAPSYAHDLLQRLRAVAARLEAAERPGV
jgi:heterotetrameric sarcosine oxidase gamma subunit